MLVIVALCGIADGGTGGVGSFAALIHAHQYDFGCLFGGSTFLIGYALLAARSAWRPKQAGARRNQGQLR